MRDLVEDVEALARGERVVEEVREEAERDDRGRLRRSEWMLNHRGALALVRVGKPAEREE